MMSVVLPPEHYAAQWSTESVRPHAEINQLGKRFAESHDQDALLELCQAFHPYLMKYLVMICSGRVPVVGIGSRPQAVNADSKPFLKYFLPKGKKASRKNLSQVAKHFHLAFKGMDTEEVYDVLTEQLVAAINGYDPLYKAKVKQVVEVINRELSKWKSFRAVDVRHHLEFDCDKHLRLLCRRGFLQTISEEGGARFERLVWPPPVEFTEGDGDVIGLAYYLQKWFRFNLQDWITKRSRELEAKDGVYSLEDWNETRAGFSDDAGGGSNDLEYQVVSADGDFQTTCGTRLSADVEMMRKPPGISQMTSGSRRV